MTVVVVVVVVVVEVVVVLFSCPCMRLIGESYAGLIVVAPPPQPVSEDSHD